MISFKNMGPEDWKGIRWLVGMVIVAGFTAWAVFDPRVIPAVRGMGAAFADGAKAFGSGALQAFGVGG